MAMAKQFGPEGAGRADIVAPSHSKIKQGNRSNTQISEMVTGVQLTCHFQLVFVYGEADQICEFRIGTISHWFLKTRERLLNL
jgi:hypothetical protein